MRSFWPCSAVPYSKAAIAEKDLEAAQDAEDKAKVDLATATNRLRILGADPAHRSLILAVKAALSETIVEQNAAGGTGVHSLGNSLNLFAIADRSHVWLDRPAVNPGGEKWSAG